MGKLYIKIPTHIVRNEDYYLSNDEFILYARLCFLYFRTYQQKEIMLDHRKLMNFLKIIDSRTFKNRMNGLYKKGLIENEISKLPTKGETTIIFNDTVYHADGHFTMLSAEVFTYFVQDQIDEYAFRQLFYYKSHINKNNDKNFCFVGYETLVKRLKVSKSKITEANEKLLKVKLIKVVKHEIKEEGYDENDELVFSKYNNHYFLAGSLF